MSPASPDDDEPLTRDDLRRLEERLQARLAEVVAWPALDDGRLAAMAARIDQADQRTESLAARVDSGIGAATNRFDVLDHRQDLLNTGLSDLRRSALAMLQGNRVAATRTTVVGTVVTSASTS